MTVLAIDHILLAMPKAREADARAFYTGILGLTEQPKPAALAQRGGCWFERGAVKVHLGVEVDFRPARKAHPAFLIDDLASLETVLNDAGYATERDAPLEGYVRLFVHDPFDNRTGREFWWSLLLPERGRRK